MDIDSIVGELRRREELVGLVDAILVHSLVRDHRTKVRRGVIHKLIADALGVRQSSRLRTLVNERMEHLGFPRSILHGARFFRGCHVGKIHCDSRDWHDELKEI